MKARVAGNKRKYPEVGWINGKRNATTQVWITYTPSNVTKNYSLGCKNPKAIRLPVIPILLSIQNNVDVNLM